MFSVSINIIKKEMSLKAIGEAIRLNQPLNEFMIAAFREGYIDIVQYLIEVGVPFAPQGAEKMALRLPTANLLVSAAHNGYGRVAQTLCPILIQMITETKSDILTPECELHYQLRGLLREAFCEAIYNQYFDIAKIIFDCTRLTDIDTGFRELFERTKDIKAIEFFVSNTKNHKYWDIKSENFDYMVGCAIRNNRADVLKLLLSTEKPISDGIGRPIYQNDGESDQCGNVIYSKLGEAFAKAAENGFVDVVQVILDSGRPVGTNSACKSCLTDALRKAAKSGHRRIVEIIKSHEPVSIFTSENHCSLFGSSAASSRSLLDFPSTASVTTREIPKEEIVAGFIAEKLGVKCTVSNIPSMFASIKFPLTTSAVQLSTYARQLESIIGTVYEAQSSDAFSIQLGLAPKIRVEGGFSDLDAIIKKLQDMPNPVSSICPKN
ncbi:MAG: hypothetical protein A2X78_01375 [Gammaproteobacteria bacterium GWE2_37_16]|nr:MAG: hypothetical protein A2X78_01375 [Gammaproteobacteria bacterium GWE2_37_16]